MTDVEEPENDKAQEVKEEETQKSKYLHTFSGSRRWYLDRERTAAHVVTACL